MDKGTQVELEAAAFRRLVEQLRERTDVQNIDLMELAGFCRNCLVALVPGGGRAARDGADRPAGARDRLRNALRRVEVSPPNLSRALLSAACVAALAGCGNGAARRTAAAAAAEVVLTPEAGAQGRAAAADEAVRREQRSAARAVELRGAGAPPDSSAGWRRPQPRRADRRRGAHRAARGARRAGEFRDYLNTTAFLPTGPRASVRPDGSAVAPEDAPEIVKRVILAGNAIAKFPYKWGGGHGAWRDNGYDCSGLGLVRAGRRRPAEPPAHLGPVHALRRGGPGRVDHDLRERRPRVHAGGRPALRHQRPGPRRHALAGRAAAARRLRGAPHPRALAACTAAPRPSPSAAPAPAPADPRRAA